MRKNSPRNEPVVQLAIPFILTTGVGWLMIVLGHSKRSLDWTRPPRCPGCGRERNGRCGCER